MSSTSPAPADFWDKYHAERSGDVRPFPVGTREERIVPPPRRRRRPFRAFLRFLIILGLGVGGTLAWQAYGDMAREMAATAYPEQLGWLMPDSPTNAPAATSVPAPAPAATATAAAPPAATPDSQQLNAMSLGLAGLRRSIEELAAQVASGQQQMAGDIARLQTSEQDILNKISATPPTRSAAPPPAPGRKPSPMALTPTAH